MADLSSLRFDKPLAVLGLGLSGRAVVEACQASGVAYAAWDDNAGRRSGLVVQDFTNDLSGYAALVPAAGIKPSHPVLQLAAKQSIPVLSDIDLLLQSAPEARVIGITGTNGKSTTTALIGHILQENGVKAAVGGNIGVAAASLPSLDQNGVYVLELSSYQLEITATPICDIAVFLNLTPDHLDWHGDVESYLRAKAKITLVRPDRPKQQLIIGAGTTPTAQLAMQMASSPLHRVTTVSVNGEVKDGSVAVNNGLLFDDENQIADLNAHPYLRGEHNHENIAAAYAACKAFGLAPAQIIPALFTFTGLAHRQKNLGTVHGVTFINDSKATNTDATAKALAAYDNIYWIAGGQPTDAMLDGLDIYFPKIRHAYLIGEASADFAAILKGRVATTECDVMAEAVKRAYHDAVKAGGGIVLLAPACKSWDQYKSFEERGDDFASRAAAIMEQSA